MKNKSPVTAFKAETFFYSYKSLSLGEHKESHIFLSIFGGFIIFKRANSLAFLSLLGNKIYKRSGRTINVFGFVFEASH